MLCNAAWRHYLHLSAKMGLMEGLLNWCMQRLVIIMGLGLANSWMATNNWVVMVLHLKRHMKNEKTTT